MTGLVLGLMLLAGVLYGWKLLWRYMASGVPLAPPVRSVSPGELEGLEELWKMPAYGERDNA